MPLVTMSIEKESESEEERSLLLDIPSTTSSAGNASTFEEKKTPASCPAMRVEMKLEKENDVGTQATHVLEGAKPHTPSQQSNAKVRLMFSFGGKIVTKNKHTIYTFHAEGAFTLKLYLPGEDFHYSDEGLEIMFEERFGLDPDQARWVWHFSLRLKYGMMYVCPTSTPLVIDMPVWMLHARPFHI